MHDFWSSTGICHYPGSCAHYKASCGNCQYLPGGGYKKDLSFRTWKRKRKLYERGNIIFVACSKWLQGKARESSLLKDLLVESIPNPIDTTVYCPADKKVARQHLGLPEDMSLILFVSQRITDERKGINYFIDAMNLLVERHPEMKQNTGVVILGGKSDEVADRLPVKTFSVGYVADEKKIIEIYNSVDLYVLPSLEDNLPNTIMESMACGVPCVGFKTGGIPEMIDHQKNGYVAEYKNTEDLARGIRWTLFDTDAAQLSLAAVEKVKSHYSQNSIVLRYVEVYNQAIASSRIGI
jgi:glycosyltransferase involved in cell wall biosynthesis